VNSLKICSVLAATAVFATACGKTDDTAAAQPPQGSASKTAGGNGGGNNGGLGGPGGGRAAASITLASTDVHVVKRGEIEEFMAITGDLRPIETVDIRARIEGDLIGVYVREGEHVKAGQLLARFEDSEQSSGLASARADKLAADGENTTAKWNLEQTTELFKAGAVAERDFKFAQQTAATAAARLAAADARVRAATSLVADTRATATTEGVISLRSVENGEHISRGASMFTLVRTNVLELAAAVPSRFAGAVRVGQTVTFVADGREFDGKIARISPTVDPASRSVAIYVQIPNPQDALKGGTFASGRIVSRTVSKTLIVPTAAIRLTQDQQQFVYRIAGKSIDVANVQLGIVDERGGMAEIVNGLSEGDRVITGNVGTSLGRGMQVIIAGDEQPRQGQPRNTKQ
jgi:membrane fusion protein (multidrug efflux system)